MLFVASCDDSIKLNEFLQDSGTSYQVLTAFGELIQTSPNRVAHYLEIQLTPASSPIFAPTTGEITYQHDLDGLPTCVVIKPKLRDDKGATPLEKLGPGLADAEDIRIALCNLDNSGGPSPLHTAIQTLYTEANDPDPGDKATRFFDTALAPKDRRGSVWAAPEAVMPDPPAGGDKKRWSRLGPAAGGKLRIAVFRMKDDHPIYLNPAPYLAKIPINPGASALRMPKISEIKIETASDANFTNDVKIFDIDINTGAITPDQALEGFLRVFFRLTRNADDGGSTPVIAPQELSYSLSRVAGATQDVRSNAFSYVNSLATSAAIVLDTSSHSMANILYRIGGSPGTSSNPSTEELWMQLPFDPHPLNQSGSVPKYDIGSTISQTFIDLGEIHNGQPRYPSGDYELEVVLASGFGIATSASKKMLFRVRGLANIEFVADGGNDQVVDHTDPVIDHVQVGHWGADSGDGVDGFTAAGAVRNGVPPDNFANRDPERFYVRITDATKNTNAGSRDSITAKIGTLAANGTTDDDLTDIRLDETGNSTGVFVSKAQLLVGPDLPAETFTDGNANCVHDAGEAFVDADGDGNFDTDNPDDDLATHDGIAGPVCDDAANDRTHRASVDGRVHVEYQVTAMSTASASLFVCDRTPEERRVLNVAVHIFNEPFADTGFDHDANAATPLVGAGDGAFSFADANGNGTHDAGERSEQFIDISGGAAAFGVAGSRGQIWSNAAIDRHMAHLELVLASACIRLVEQGRRVVDPTGTLFLHTPGFFDDFPDDDGVTGTPSRDEALIQSPNFRSAVNLDPGQDNDLIDVYFVAPLTPAGGALASQFRPGMVAANGLNNLLINQVHVGLSAAGDNRISSLTHELMHQLTNRPHFGAPPAHIIFPRTGPPADDGRTWISRRRITAATTTLARTSRGASMAADGNNVLRTP